MKAHLWRSMFTTVPLMTLKYLEIGEVFGHEAVDLTDRQASCFTVPQSHEDQHAAAVEEIVWHQHFIISCTLRLLYFSRRKRGENSSDLPPKHCCFGYNNLNRNAGECVKCDAALPVWVDGFREDGVHGPILVRRRENMRVFTKGNLQWTETHGNQQPSFKTRSFCILFSGLAE